ncbi:MAG: arylamine N-acetyltransferase [Vicinamibacterales bacterium]
MVDLDAYFRRIGYGGPVPLTVETLHDIMDAHVRAVPFENLDVLLGRGIDLAPEAVDRKILDHRRGGYCFEQNSLLLRVLQTLGFDVTPLSARVRWQRPRDFTPARTHLFLRVVISDVPWVADVGVGALSLTSAIRFDVEGEQATRHEPRRIVFEDGRYFHQARLGDAWHDVLEFTGEVMPPIDRELGNWYTSTHPQSHFRARLVAARALPDGGRLTLVNRELTRRPRSGEAQVSIVESPRALVEVLGREFGLEFPPDTVFPCSGLVWDGQGT